MNAAKKHGYRYCETCGTKLLKNGKENGKQRWRCLQCGTARIRSRADVADLNRRKAYAKHLLNKGTALEVAERIGISRRTFDRNYTTRFQGISHGDGQQLQATYVVIDAKRLGYGIVAIARNEVGQLHWRYAPYESSDVWCRILSVYQDAGQSRLCAIVSDGQKGIQKAAAICFGDAIVLQRCHFHVKHNLQAKLTKHPATAAGQDLQLLAVWLAKVKTWDDMALFIGVFHGLFEAYGPFLWQRTYHTSTANGRRRWSYTHARVRSAYRQVDDLIDSDQLFAYITHPELQLPNTTNHVEGGLNARMSELTRAHRGLLPERQRQMIDVFLTSKQPPC